MSKPIEKTSSKPLVHRPWDVLEVGQYDAQNRNWRRFDESVSEQIRELEFQNRQYIRVSTAMSRRSTQ
jgi:hypothetical protein